MENNEFNVGDKVRILPDSNYDQIDEESEYKVEGTVGTITEIDEDTCMVLAGEDIDLHMFEDGRNFHLCFYTSELELMK